MTPEAESASELGARLGVLPPEDIVEVLKDALQVVEPGKGVAAPRKSKEVKVVDKPLPKAEAQLVRSINVRSQRVEDHRLSLTYELTELKKLVEGRGEDWTAYRKKHITLADRAVRDYIADGAKPDVAKALEDRRARNAEANKKLRKKQKMASRDATKGRKKGGRNADDLEIFSTWFTKGKVREDSGSVVVTWTTSEWRNLQDCLDRLRGL